MFKSFVCRNVLLLSGVCNIFSVFASTISLTINYPESQLNSSYISEYDKIFNLNVYSCMENHVENDAFTYGSPSCPGNIKIITCVVHK
jgi:hypothetical protein